MRLREEIVFTRLRRARTAVGRGIKYRLGHGGMDPFDSLPSRTGYCDCSGFAAWTAGISRRPKPNRPWWIETTNIFNDATGKRRTYVRLDEIEKGCWLVFPDKRVAGVTRQGHIVLVTGVSNGKVTGIDCSAGNLGRFKESIRERDVTWMLKRGAIPVALKQDLA